MRNATYTLLISLAVFTAGCAANKSKGQPDWVNGNSAGFPAAHYLIGRGQSDNAAVARDRARADLAKIFQVDIDEQTTDTTTHTSKRIGKLAETSLEAAVERNIYSKTEQTLSDVNIAELWQNPKNKQHHALAVLDRLKASNRLRNEVRQLDETTRKAISAAKQQRDLLARIGYASRAVQAQQERKQLQKYLQVVDKTGMGISSPFNLSSLLQDRDALLKRLRVQAVTATDPVGGIDEIVKGALAKAGFLNEDEKANYSLNAQLTLSEHQDNKGWFWYRGTLDVALNELPANKNRGSYRWPFKVASQHKEVAAKRVRDTLDKKLKNELRDVIISFAIPD